MRMPTRTNEIACYLALSASGLGMAVTGTIAVELHSPLLAAIAIALLLMALAIVSQVVRKQTCRCDENESSNPDRVHEWIF